MSEVLRAFRILEIARGDLEVVHRVLFLRRLRDRCRAIERAADCTEQRLWEDDAQRSRERERHAIERSRLCREAAAILAQVGPRIDAARSRALPGEW